MVPCSGRCVSLPPMATRRISLGKLPIPEPDIGFVMLRIVSVDGLDAVDEIPVGIRDGPSAADAARARGIARMIDGNKCACGLGCAKDT